MKEWFYKVSVVILGMGVVSCSSSKESVSSVSSPSVESNSSPHFVIASSGGPHTATGSSYDVNGNPAFESSSGLETRYKYDTNLRLIEQEVRPQGQSTPGTKFRSVYNAEGVKIASFLPDGTIDTFHPSTRMRKKPGSVLAMISYEGGEIDETTPSRFNKLIKDHLGSVVAVANTLGFEEVKDVLPYGQDFYRSTTPHTSYGFNGNKEEGISSLNKPLLDYNARYYAPGRGRFTGVDTVVPDPGSVTGYNRYTYTSNNPVNRIDPTGHAPEEITIYAYSEEHFLGGLSRGFSMREDFENMKDVLWWSGMPGSVRARELRSADDLRRAADAADNLLLNAHGSPTGLFLSEDVVLNAAQYYKALKGTRTSRVFHLDCFAAVERVPIDAALGKHSIGAMEESTTGVVTQIVESGLAGRSIKFEGDAIESLDDPLLLRKEYTFDFRFAQAGSHNLQSLIDQGIKVGRRPPPGVGSVLRSGRKLLALGGAVFAGLGVMGIADAARAGDWNSAALQTGAMAERHTPVLGLGMALHDLGAAMTQVNSLNELGRNQQSNPAAFVPGM